MAAGKPSRAWRLRVAAAFWADVEVQQQVGQLLQEAGRDEEARHAEARAQASTRLAQRMEELARVHGEVGP